MAWQCLFTWVPAFYTIVSERAAACHPAYDMWAVRALERTIVVFWLVVMGATPRNNKRPPPRCRPRRRFRSSSSILSLPCPFFATLPSEEVSRM